MKYTKEANVKYSYSRPKKDVTGLKFNKLIVNEWLGFKNVGNQNKRRSIYKCTCECGNTCEVAQNDLSSGNVKSCGCLVKQGSSYKGDNYSNISAVMNNYIQSAKRFNREFNLKREDFIKLITDNCYYCGDSPKTEKISYNKHKNVLLYNGIDRVDNTKGYTIDNTVTCCTECNFMKKDMTKEHFLKIIEKIYTCRIK